MKPRPMLDLPPSQAERIWQALALAGLLACACLFLSYWPALPASIPTHFNLAGQADDWGSKSVFVVFPAMALVMFALIEAISRFPHVYNYPWQITETNAAAQYRLARGLLAWVRACTVWLMASLTWLTGRTALGAHDPSLPNSLVLLLGLLLAAGIGVYFYRAWQAR